MQATASQAIIPKARGMYAKRITDAEYEELMRRRTVPEVASLLKRHPYYRDSLASLSLTDPHRGQIEELLNMDIFTKYSALVHYDFSGTGFSRYYLVECEIREILKAIHLLSIGIPGGYLNQMPTYLVGKTRVDLFALGQAKNFAEILEVVRLTPYYKPLRGRYMADPFLRDYPMTEASLLHQSYTALFALIDKTLSGRDAKAVRELFLQECEIYNLDLLIRVKSYFPGSYTPEELWQLLLPYRYHLPKHTLAEMTEAKTADALVQMFIASPAVKYTGPLGPEEVAAEGSRSIHKHAKQVLRLSSSPGATLAAFLTLAKLDKENIVNVIEGVRYGLEPERVRAMLVY